MFEEHQLYRHVSCLDIDIYVIRVMHFAEESMLRVGYWNRHMKSFQGDFENVFVKQSEFKKWSKINA